MQGVGFRPYVHRLATSRKLDGFVRNAEGGVVIAVQGDAAALEDFMKALTSNPPPLARIRRIRIVDAGLDSSRGFSIAEASAPISEFDFAIADAFQAGVDRTLVAPDVATCGDCLGELFDRNDRRYQYPFINCTHCGPRFTIIEGVPYDRPNTTMAAFAMCGACRAEYEDPGNRRFHAQPIACAECGPVARFAATDGSHGSTGVEAVRDAGARLAAGGIVAIKGLGGYHLACDATSAGAVRRLRARKHREARPFAIMVEDAAAAARLCHMEESEAAVLESRERPIVLLRRRRSLDGETESAAEEIAPRAGRLGVMLPYTPLHHLLLKAAARPLVLTSGNISDEPIAFDDGDAHERLGPLVDARLWHDRLISARCDDSVMHVAAGAPAFIRRSRGFAPAPIETSLAFPRHVLAMGGQLKNTFCVARDHTAFVSQHIGDLHTAAAANSLARGIAHFAALVGVRPEVVVHDLHPDYVSTRLAAEQGVASRVPVQHHHAHVAACMAEHGVSERVLGVVFDGAGLGTDGAIWGGEFLLVDRTGFQRVGQLGYVPLPGGDAAARRPGRMAVAHLWSAFGRELPPAAAELVAGLPGGELALVRQMLERGINSPPTSSVGRLFDAVAALAGVRDVAEFEGQAAMELEAVADHDSSRAYAMEIAHAGDFVVADPGSLIRAVADDARAGVTAGEMSAGLHNGLAQLIVEVAESVRRRTGVNDVALSGGVFQNTLLLSRAVARLQGSGFDVLTHRLVPCNDGGLSLGQAYVVALSGEVA